MRPVARPYLHLRLGPVLDEKSRMRPGRQETLRHQAVIRVHHGEHAHAVGMGELSNGGGFGARPQRTVLDELAKAVHDLQNQRGRTLRVNREHAHLPGG
jgi:hypothetical protein